MTPILLTILRNFWFLSGQDNLTVSSSGHRAKRVSGSDNLTLTESGYRVKVLSGQDFLIISESGLGFSSNLGIDTLNIIESSSFEISHNYGVVTENLSISELGYLFINNKQNVRGNTNTLLTSNGPLTVDGDTQLTFQVTEYVRVLENV